MIVAVVNPLESMSDEWIEQKMTVLLDVIGKIRPELANVIITTPGGQKWFADSLTDLKHILFGRPQINIEKP
ncbi:unnamed protein product [marine sediment metagenome]|uniref:Uncharacterized protein n=1 Tax=marine sediment metagenome TaxID=412755 RepID=X1IWA0_9ZZZZ